MYIAKAYLTLNRKMNPKSSAINSASFSPNLISGKVVTRTFPNCRPVRTIMQHLLQYIPVIGAMKKFVPLLSIDHCISGRSFELRAGFRTLFLFYGLDGIYCCITGLQMDPRRYFRRKILFMGVYEPRNSQKHRGMPSNQ